MHRSNWEDWGVPRYAPTVVKSADGHVKGLYRGAFVNAAAGYGCRAASESVKSGIKRTSGSTLRSRKENTLFTEATFSVLTYAIKR